MKNIRTTMKQTRPFYHHSLFIIYLADIILTSTMKKLKTGMMMRIENGVMK
jgi:hypothetical protein